MRIFYLSLVLTSIWLTGCETATTKTDSNANNTNNTGQNVNVASNQTKKAVDEEEVPKFEDADEALKKGDDYLDNNKTKKAINAFKQATEINPDLADAHFKLGISYALIETEEDSKVQPADLEEETPKKKKKVEKKKNSEKAFQNAVKAYKKFIRQNPKDAEAHYNLGRSYIKLFDDKQAEKSLQRAVKLKDDDSVYRTELGAVLNNLAKYPSAIKQLNKAIELDEDNSRAEDLLAEAKAGRKRTSFKKKDKK